MTEDDDRLFANKAKTAKNHGKFCRDAIHNFAKGVSLPGNSSEMIAREAGEVIRTLQSAIHTFRNIEQAANMVRARERRESGK